MGSNRIVATLILNNFRPCVQNAGKHSLHSFFVAGDVIEPIKFVVEVDN